MLEETGSQGWFTDYESSTGGAAIITVVPTNADAVAAITVNVDGTELTDEPYTFQWGTESRTVHVIVRVDWTGGEYTLYDIDIEYTYAG